MHHVMQWVCQLGSKSFKCLCFFLLDGGQCVFLSSMWVGAAPAVWGVREGVSGVWIWTRSRALVAQEPMRELV